ncbi:MAG: hypothetical protein N2578_03425 [Bdellovibrionaceae bacterium]|nr:hypothetical protein [Pseudobdellovibrionaceae bacterium]
MKKLLAFCCTLVLTSFPTLASSGSSEILRVFCSQDLFGYPSIGTLRSDVRPGYVIPSLQIKWSDGRSIQKIGQLLPLRADQIQGRLLLAAWDRQDRVFLSETITDVSSRTGHASALFPIGNGSPSVESAALSLENIGHFDLMDGTLIHLSTDNRSLVVRSWPNGTEIRQIPLPQPAAGPRFLGPDYATVLIQDSVHNLRPLFVHLSKATLSRLPETAEPNMHQVQLAMDHRGQLSWIEVPSKFSSQKQFLRTVASSALGSKVGVNTFELGQKFKVPLSSINVRGETIYVYLHEKYIREVEETRSVLEAAEFLLVNPKNPLSAISVPYPNEVLEFGRSIGGYSRLLSGVTYSPELSALIFSAENFGGIVIWKMEQQEWSLHGNLGSAFRCYNPKYVREENP